MHVDRTSVSDYASTDTGLVMLCNFTLRYNTGVSLSVRSSEKAGSHTVRKAGKLQFSCSYVGLSYLVSLTVFGLLIASRPTVPMPSTPVVWKVGGGDGRR